MIENENEVTQDQTLAGLPPVPDESESATAQVQVSTPEVSKSTPKPASGQQENFRILRERAERAEREREEYSRKLAEIEAKSKHIEQVPEEDLEVNLGADEIAEGKHLSKIGRKMKQLEQKIAEAEQKRIQLEKQSESNAIIANIKADFPDIDKVVNEATMEALRQRSPEIEKTIRSSNDLYSKAAAAYRIIKDMGLYVDDAYAADKAKVQSNMAKPRSTAAVSGTSSPLSQADIFANGLTPELKDRLHKEMIEAIKAR
jgi:DNA repair exonuclease SbcCD ATPase subunit